MAQQQLYSPQVKPPPPSSHWEGGGYHSESSRSVLDDKCLQTTTIIIPNIEGTYNNDINSHTINYHISQPPAPLPIKKDDIPPPPQMNYNHYIHPMHIQSQHIQTLTVINNNNNNNVSVSNSTTNSPNQLSLSQSKIPLNTNGLINISTADSMVEMDNIQTPQSQLSKTYNNNNNINIIQQGEMDDGIDTLSIDVDHININEYNNNNNIESDEEIDKLMEYNKHINMLFGNKLIRSLYMNATLFFFCILSFPLWFGDVSGIDKQTDNDITNAYIIAAFSMFVTFIASGFGLIFGIFEIFDMEIPFKKIGSNVTMVMYFVGGFFYFVASCQYAQFYNSLGVLLDKDLSGFGGIYFGEMFYISVYIIMVGIDFWKPFLNRMDHRIYLFFTLYVFCSLVLMFSYLICFNKLNENKSFVVIGILYLFDFIVSMLFLVLSIASNIITKEFVIKPKLDQIKLQSDRILSILTFMCMFGTVIAYWTTERIRDAEKVYYAGFGIFILSNAVLMTFDMRFSLYIAKFIQEDH